MSKSDKSQEQQLGLLRDEIDRIDQEIQSLINQRAVCAQRVAEVKQNYQGVEDAVFYRPEREAQVLRRVMERNQGPLGNEEMARLFRELMSACLAHEKTMQVAFLGPEGTFTQSAALKHFGHSVNTLPMGSIDEVFREVEAKTAHYGVVPIENSSEGMVNHTLDSFRQSNLVICGEVEMRVHQNLLIKADTDLGQIKRIYSHQQSLAQCRTWLDTHLSKVERIEVNSNAEAARRVAQAVEDDGSVAAIAGALAADLYGLEIAHANIEDQPDNTTRFLIIGHNSVPVSGQDKTSILVMARNKSGALYHILEPFQRHNVSMTSIESRPSGAGLWGYVFYIDFEGHVDDANVQGVLADLESEVAELRILGSYPQAVL
ncbi:MAG TPA: prephenate dehydratase [Oceanospirillaceae bacterium]|nr:prephenate dehydratase [Oceanospirillaceae bacterium]